MNRDDMVMSPSIGRQREPTAATRARDQRRMERTRRGGTMQQLARTRAARSLARKRRAARAGARRVAAARAGRRGLIRGAAKGTFMTRGMRKGAALIGKTGRQVVGGPAIGALGATVIALVVAGMVTLRLATGQPFEGMGEQLNKMFLGDMDEEARAKIAVRNQLQGDPALARIVGQQGQVNSQIASIAQDLHKLRKREELGATLFRQEFPTNNIMDMLILRAASVFKRAWNSNGGPDATERFRNNYRELLLQPPGAGSR